MLKKAGIVVAAAATALLAVSPLAFATESDTNNNGSNSQGLINASGNNAAAGAQLCNNDVPVQVGLAQIQAPIKDITGGASGALGILGTAGSAVTQDVDNSRSCGDNSVGAGDVATQVVDD